MKSLPRISWTGYLIIFVAFAVVSSALALSAGEFSITVFNIPKILFSQPDSIEYLVITEIRMPRVLLGLAVGGSLGIAGVILQGVYRNPLVEPYTLGISGGAALGVAVAIVMGISASAGAISIPVFGFLGAVVTVSLVYVFSSWRQKVDTNQMVLVGVMVSFISTSLMLLIMALTTGQNLQGIFFWVMGSLDVANKSMVAVAVAVALFGLVASYFLVHPLNALRLGNDQARHLGINTNLLVRILFLLASLLAGVSVAVAGVIGFVGLVVPHFTRGVVGSDFRILLVCSFLAGGGFLVLCDALAKTIIAPSELPIGVITGIVGGITFIAILVSKSFKNRYL
jgi:iron complex transport system permease protein